MEHEYIEDIYHGGCFGIEEEEEIDGNEWII